MALLLGLGLATPALATTISVDPDRTITVSSMVTGSIINDAATLTEMADDNDEDVYIVLNSPGRGPPGSG